MTYEYLFLGLIGMVVGIYAQMKLSSTYQRYIRVASDRGLTGAQAARLILDESGLHQMPVLETPGHLTDHYDPLKKALYLSSENYHGDSLAALGVAAHEAGHALQHKAHYAPLHLRMAMVPLTNFASMAYLGIFILGAVLNLLPIALWVVVGLFMIITLFQLITLPVEYDASRRAKERLLALGLISPQEREGVSKVLNAAALTYVAALVTSALHLLHYILMLNRTRDQEG